MSEELEKLLRDVQEYIEDREETIDGEWGYGRKREALISEGAMPEIYQRVKDAIK